MSATIADEALPGIPGPEGEPPRVVDLDLMTPRALAINVVGTGLWSVATAGGVLYLVVNAPAGAAAWPLVLLAIAAATYVSDFVSGVLHWAFDTWFSEKSGARRMVLIVREHHLRPARIHEYGLRDEVGTLSWFGMALMLPLLLPSARADRPATGPQYARAAAGVTMSLQVVFMLWFHKFGHRMHRGRLTRALQRSRLLLSPEVHGRHHAGRHDERYCLINGLADDTLGRLGAFRLLERAVTRATGAVPREDDRRWARRYGRPR